MQHSIKSKLTIAIIAAITAFSPIKKVYANIVSVVTTNAHETLYISEDFPYTNLLDKSESVKIIFTEDNNDIQCSVELELDDLHLKSKSRTTSKDKFTKMPLSSCLQHKQAKDWLRVLYKIDLPGA